MMGRSSTGDARRPDGWRIAGGAAIVIGLVGLPAAAAAQSRPPISISVGRIASEKSCTLYQESAGASAIVATAHGIAAAESWRTWLVRDCVDNFASIRTSLEAALAASGKFVLRPSGGAYVVSGRISDVGGDGDPAPEAPNPGRGGYAVASSHMFVNMDVNLADASGRIVHGALLTKRIETGSDARVGSFRATSSQSGQALYTSLQHEVALAVARQVAFHLVPLRVVGAEGPTIRLNYGAPLLTLGAMLQATSPDGSAVVRYSVTSAGPGSATAERDGEGDGSRIVPGSTAIVIEPEDPAANGRRFKRVELP